MDDLIPADFQPDIAGAEQLTSDTDPAIASHLFKPHLKSTGCTRPFDLLIAAHRALDLVGRDEELAALTAWLAAPTAVSAQCIIGGAGAGKRGWQSSCACTPRHMIGRLVSWCPILCPRPIRQRISVRSWRSWIAPLPASGSHKFAVC